jgi:hypothetical protein
MFARWNVKCELRCMRRGHREDSDLDDCLNSLLCVGGILVTLLIEKLKLIVMGEIGSCHLSFASVARRCF